jgi:hypothetical protein
MKNGFTTPECGCTGHPGSGARACKVGQAHAPQAH